MIEDQEILFEDEEESHSLAVEDYKVSTSPNDFNIQSLVDYIDKGLLVIPGFQRNYVWDIKRASRLIESLLIGLPIPQIFLYEHNKKFLVIDGQQRLMSIYYFKKGRFPKKEKRGELRDIYLKNNKVPENIIANNDFYQEFRLNLSKSETGIKNRFSGLAYGSLADHQFSFDMKTIRSITIKQNFPDDDDSSMYEVFNRLNTGGVSLKPQEIRSSMYYSEFYKMLNEINTSVEWRSLLPSKHYDLHMKDIEVLLRSIGLLTSLGSYRQPMLGFLNMFSKKMMLSNDKEISLLKDLVLEFLKRNRPRGESIFVSKNRFVISFFEAIFIACTEDAYKIKDPSAVKSFSESEAKDLLASPDFVKLMSTDTTNPDTILKRIEKARAVTK